MAAPTFSTTDHPGPATDAEPVTPSDTTTLGQLARGLYVGATGNVSVLLRDGSSVTFVGVQGGTTLPIRCRRVNATGTTASSILALY